MDVSNSRLMAPDQFRPLADRSQPAPITGMRVNTGINPPNLSFAP
jgi:hypothetical protein